MIYLGYSHKEVEDNNKDKGQQSEEEVEGFLDNILGSLKGSGGGGGGLF
jgi:hypothetical protein